MNLKLDIDLKKVITLRLPAEPEFSDDEFEIWLVDDENEICLFKDSHRYAYCESSAYVLRSFRLGELKMYAPKDVDFSHWYFYYCQSLPEADESVHSRLVPHKLFAYRDRMTWLYTTPNGDAGIEIATICPFSDDPYFEIEYRLEVDRRKFIEWFEALLVYSFA